MNSTPPPDDSACVDPYQTRQGIPDRPSNPGESGGNGTSEAAIDNGPASLASKQDSVADLYPSQTSTRPGVAAPSLELTNSRIDNYVVERLLGRGGMGEVYVAHHFKFPDRKFAIKVILNSVASADAIARFENEIHAMGEAKHPNLLYAHDAGYFENRPYLVTEFIEGIDLGALLRLQRQLSVAVACEIIRQLSTGLDFVHRAGIVHRDIKPSNVMLQGNGQVKVLDLGLASIRNSDHQDQTQGSDSSDQNADLIDGTPEFMSPEHWQGRTAVASDIYSLGCTFYCLLTGKPPFRLSKAGSLQNLRRLHQEEKVPRINTVRPDVPGEVAHLIHQCLAKEPDQRPTSCQEIALLLEPYAAPLDATQLIPQQQKPEELDLFKQLTLDLGRVNEELKRPARVYWFIFAFGLIVSYVSLIMSYFGPGTTLAWSQRFDHLKMSNVATGTGFAIESMRVILFLALVLGVSYRRYYLPLQRFFSPRLHGLQVWIARTAFALLLGFFLQQEFTRHWFEPRAAADMVAWAVDKGLPPTTTGEEVIPYRWYFGYSAIHYSLIIGGLVACPILQFLLADFRKVRRLMSRFTESQTQEVNAIQSVNLLRVFGLYIRQIAYRYVDTAGVLAVGIQFEYWIGSYTLSENGFAVESQGMTMVAIFMLMILAFLAWTYTQAIEITGRSPSVTSDYRIDGRLQQFDLLWFLKSVFLTRLSGIMVLSLIVPAILSVLTRASR